MIFILLAINAIQFYSELREKALLYLSIALNTKLIVSSSNQLVQNIESNLFLTKSSLQTLPYDRKTLYRTNWYLFGYLFHYIPFYLMGRVLYFHHFYSAFIFNCALTAGTTEMLLSRCTSPRKTNMLRVALLCVVVASFVAFAPLAYGISIDEDNKTQGYVTWFRWLDTWRF